MIPERTLLASKEGSNSLTQYDPREAEQWPAWNNSYKGTVVHTCIFTLVVTTVVTECVVVTNSYN